MSNIVEFPTGERELNMAPYGANSTTVQYSLYGICNHMGKLHRKQLFFSFFFAITIAHLNEMICFLF